MTDEEKIEKKWQKINTPSTTTLGVRKAGKL
jgi:hypothetical protein